MDRIQGLHPVAKGKGNGMRVIADSSHAIEGVGRSSASTIRSVNQGRGSAGDFEINNQNSNAAALSCNTSGTGHALVVSGTAYKSDGNPNWTIVSDRRIKKDIRPFLDGLSVLNQINPISFRYNGLAGTKLDQGAIGVIAQEMEEIAPYMVKKKLLEESIEGPEDDRLTEILTYNPSYLTYVMVKAIKEVYDLVQKQQLVIENQAADIKLLKQMLPAFRTEQLKINSNNPKSG